MDLSKVWNLSCRSDLNNIAQSYSEIFSDSFVHSQFSLLKFIIDKGDNEGLFSLFTLDKDSVSFEYF